jgi:ATP-dependent 26S proteasome regulatory subunit
MHKMAATLPVAPDVDLATMAKALAGHPLSDVTFVVRESARLAVRAGHEALTQAQLEAALAAAKARTKQGSESNPIGFY